MVSRYKYLGKKVQDIPPKGLTSPKEVRGILRAILRDYRSGRISWQTARGRLLLLYRLTYAKHNKNLRASRRTRALLREEISKVMSSLRKRKRR